MTSLFTRPEQWVFDGWMVGMSARSSGVGQHTTTLVLW